jgi:hypothetical protein
VSWAGRIPLFVGGHSQKDVRTDYYKIQPRCQADEEFVLLQGLVFVPGVIR